MSLRSLVRIVLASLALAGCGGSKPDPAHVIRGTIAGRASSGVTLTLSGDGAATTISDGSGHYAFSVHDGTYTVTPALAGGYLFSAPSRSVTVNGADVVGQDFLARGAYGLRGTVAGAVASGVTVSLSGAASAVTTTDPQGAYAFTGLTNGTYTVTPALAGGYLFSAPSHTVTVNGADVAGQDFLARGAYGIRGTVTGAVVSNVPVTLSGAATAETTTDPLGAYAFTGLANGTYLVTPSWSGFVFRPANRQVVLDGGAADAADFDGVPEEPAIAGAAASPSTLYPGQLVTFSAEVSSPLGLPVSSLWDFGDGSVAADGPAGSHAYAAPGIYVATLRARDSAGRSAAASTPVTILDVLPAASLDGALAPFCSGPLCAAVDASTYRGSGVGIWRYHNAAQAPATIDVTLNGVNAKTRVTLVFANGRATAAPTVPSPGLLLGQAAPPPDPVHLAASSAPLDSDQHALMVKRNLEIARLLAADGSAASAASATAGPTGPVEGLAPRPAPAPGTTRTWNEIFTGAVIAYPTTVHFTCPLPTGRTAVFWVDPSLLAATSTIEARIAELEDAFCAPGDGYADLTRLLGDVWGPAAASNRSLIQDAPGAPLDVNIAILGIPGLPVWAGYFSAENNFLAAARPSSNEALAFFLNGAAMGLSPPHNTATLLHEATHMINFYQRTIVRGAVHEDWLEETSATMTEDVVAPHANSASSVVTPGRVQLYAAARGGVSYVNWGRLSQAHYAMGGAFGAFLDRRYGLAVYRGLVTSCPDGQAGTTSYGCLDALIQLQGGAGLEDELARFGASALSSLPATELPWGLGYPATIAGGHVLGAIDLTRSVPPGAAPLASGFPATSHTYQSDDVDAGQTTYARTGVVVPAGTTLMVLANPRLTCSAKATGTCGQASVFCGNLCCPAAFPYLCPNPGSCHPTETAAVAFCGESCTACGSSPP